MLFIGHHKASDFTGQVAIVSHQAIAPARRYAAEPALPLVARAPAATRKNIQLPKKKFVCLCSLKKKSLFRCKIDL